MSYPPRGPVPPRSQPARPQPYQNPYAQQWPAGGGGYPAQRRPQQQGPWQRQLQWPPPQFQQPQWQPPAPKRSGSAWWLVLPLVVLGLMVGYYALTQGADDTATVDGVDYLHEDYAVPAVGEGPTQVVDTLDNPAALTDNPLYVQPVPIPVRCEPSDVTNVRDTAELQRRMDELSECLTRTFGPALEASGFQAYQPRVLVYDSAGVTPCGDLDMPNAFYCGANQGIYLSADLYRIAGTHQSRIDYVMAHEYAHNVQGRTGILIQRVYEQRKAVSEAGELEVNRRLETQADCLAASFVTSVADSVGYTDADRQEILSAARSVGDDQFLPPEDLPSTHGTSASRALWTERGFGATVFGDCNTFVAPADEVR
ncbi:MAG: hypothetical protein GX596_13130 [Propionibacterium sp.]|nr:hypothetical protein [Propionibacterium sp.]